MVERFHRQLKAAIMCHESDRWYDTLPAVLHGIRAAWKADIGASPAEILYGEPLRLPGEFFAPSKPESEDETFVAKLRRHFRRIQPVPAPHHGQRPVFIHQDLKSASHVFVRTDATKPPLQPPYEGPFRVVRRDAKYFVVDVKGKEKAVSIDRLKPSYTLAAEDGRHDAGGTTGPTPASTTTPPAIDPPATSLPDPSQAPQATRSGRRVNFPKHLEEFAT
jgi:cleavage and polyadenylation specificity factor subunit 1